MIREIFNFDRESNIPFLYESLQRVFYPSLQSNISPLSFSLSLTHTHTHAHAHTHTHTYTLFLFYTHPRTLSLYHTHIHTLYHSHSFSLSFSLLSSGKWLSQRDMKYERFNAQTKMLSIHPITSFISRERE